MSEAQGCLYRWLLLWCAERIYVLRSSCLFAAFLWLKGCVSSVTIGTTRERSDENLEPG